jgi:phenylpropionate dioxygenase-like ring-hydroxylating dioxygenase large terminal subunit
MQKMLSQADNDLLTQVGPGTPMGEMIRRFWLPALLESELPENDGKPVRLRLMGEDLVAFRDTLGRVGILEENCPHRGASLALGVNEACGLRCIFHGWKFDVNGQCLDTPTEPEASKLAKHMRAKAYPVHVAGGVVWTFMGPREQQPVFPEFPFLHMASDHSVPFKILEDCNYAQAVEGTVDSAHVGVLHRESPWEHEAKYSHEKDLRPKLEVEFTNYGLRYGAIRKLEDGQSHVRITECILPFWTMIPPFGFGPMKNRRLINAFVPRDDTSTWHIQWFFDPDVAIDVAYRIEEGGLQLDENFRKLRNFDNWYMQDREMMKTDNLSGLIGAITQDHAVCETQGRILDRTKENLGRSDMAVVAWRRLMLKAARALQNGVAPSATGNIDWSKVVSETLTHGPEDHWQNVMPLPEELKPMASAA